MPKIKLKGSFYGPDDLSSRMTWSAHAVMDVDENGHFDSRDMRAMFDLHRRLSARFLTLDPEPNKKHYSYVSEMRCFGQWCTCLNYEAGKSVVTLSNDPGKEKERRSLNPLGKIACKRCLQMDNVSCKTEMQHCSAWEEALLLASALLPLPGVAVKGSGQTLRSRDQRYSEPDKGPAATMHLNKTGFGAWLDVFPQLGSGVSVNVVTGPGFHEMDAAVDSLFAAIGNIDSDTILQCMSKGLNLESIAHLEMTLREASRELDQLFNMHYRDEQLMDMLNRPSLPDSALPSANDKPGMKIFRALQGFALLALQGKYTFSTAMRFGTLRLDDSQDNEPPLDDALAKLETWAQRCYCPSLSWERPLGVTSSLAQATKLVEGEEAVIQSLGAVLEVLSVEYRTMLEDLFKKHNINLTNLSVSDIQVLNGTKYSFDSAAALWDHAIRSMGDGNTAHLGPMMVATLADMVCQTYSMMRLVTLPPPQEGEFQPKSQSDPREFIREVHDLHCDISAMPTESLTRPRDSGLELKLCRRHYWTREPKSLGRRHRIMEVLIDLLKDVKNSLDFSVQLMPAWDGDPTTITEIELRGTAGENSELTSCRLARLVEDGDGIEDGDGNDDDGNDDDSEVDAINQLEEKHKQMCWIF
ncbi:hypothetical protein B0T26DRAFT_671375 [Lasiosphaeria miniovina]|uniref:Uncharacterized protein n=1 Tax=Lasiosphaeria miniovina TaxID=1954250 RepID=A0AA40EE95_9PEZI|nr:uncharacterized protein B0T26DRAFT_671375 [Lasiosphaeria miniovina]KAK0735202.1 hypothetical protein B0T26DRAFT_671375 [Lasiosphaeria miniovina]